MTTTNNYPDLLDHIAFPDDMETVRHFSLRLAEEPCSLRREKVFTALTASEFLRRLMEKRPRMEIGVLFLSIRNEVIGYSIAFTGIVHRVNAEPREFVVPALLAGASSIVVFRNVPAGHGEAELGYDDLALARRLEGAGELVGVELVDYLILGDKDSWVSLKDRGAW